MLLWRFIGAAAILGPLGLLLWMDARFSGTAPGIWLALPIVLVGLLAADEVVALLSAETHRPCRRAVLAGVAGILLAGCVPIFWGLLGRNYADNGPWDRVAWTMAATAAAVAGLFLVEMRRYQRPGGHTLNLALGTFAVVYVGLFLSFLIHLRTLGSSHCGMGALVTLLLIVKTSDIAAYATGKRLGRRQLAPRLSPNKTVEGALGGIVAAALAGYLCFTWPAPLWFDDWPSLAWWRGSGYGLLLGAAGMFGDLSESLLKRDGREKDSSGWLPGLGGILDVLDSVLFAAPVAYLSWAAGLVGAGCGS